MAVDQELRAAFTQQQNDTKEVSQLTGDERKQLENAIHPVINGFRAWKGVSNTNYSAWEIGDTIFNIDNSGKLQILGYVISTPFNPISDLNDKSKFDKYQNNKPSF